MGRVIKFKAQGKEYPLSIMDREGRKWVIAQQLGEALGHTNIRKLIMELQDRLELLQQKHWKNVSFVQPGDSQARVRILLSYRGVIRVAMHAESRRAREFRDWAEDVLYQVMMTGSYGAPTHKESLQAVDEAMKEGMKRGLALADALQEFPRDVIAKIVHFRRLGLTRKEAAAALDIGKDEVQRIERTLKTVGVVFDGVNLRKRDNKILANLFDNLIASTGNFETALCAIEQS